MVIEKESLEANFQQGTEAVIIRTLPNDTSKLLRQYSNTNPPYMSSQAAAFLRDKGVKHLLIDLPSVDREDDKGLLVAHHAFWNFPQNTRHDSSITELIFVPDKVCDGYYLLNLILPHLIMTPLQADQPCVKFYDRRPTKSLPC